LHNVLYDKGQQKKKTAIEQEVTQSSDYEDMKKQGAAATYDPTGKDIFQTAGRNLFGDEDKNIMELINTPAYNEAVKAISGATSVTPSANGLINKFATGVDPKYAYLKDNEKDMLRYLYAKGSKQTFKEYLRLLDADLNKSQTEGDIARQQDTFGKMGKFGDFAMGTASFANSFNTLPALAETAVNDVKQKLGAPYEKPDPYTPLQKPVVVKHAQRDFATRNLDPKAKLLANGVLDLTEFGVKAMVPVIGLPWASASAASETASDALVQGDTHEGAMKKAIAAGLETYVTGKAAEGLLKNAGGFIKDAKGGKIGAAGESTGDTGYDAYLKMLDEVKKARESGMTAREYAKSKGIPSTLSDEEAAVLDKYGVKMLDDGAGDSAPGKVEVPKPPEPASLDDVTARKWYLDAQSKISDLVDKTQTFEQQARKSYDLRNLFKTQTREAMENRVLAEQLNISDPILTWEEVVEKYTSKGYVGDTLYQEIINASQRSRTSVNEALGIYRK
jgi:hypothetical protein